MRMTILKTIAWTIAWYAVARMLVIFVIDLDLSWNFFDWHLTMDFDSIGYISGILVTALTLVAIERRVKNGWTLFAIGIGGVVLLAFGIMFSVPEEITTGFAGRDRASPIWYRFGRLVIMALPILILCFRIWSVRKDGAGWPNKATLSTPRTAPSPR